MNFSREILRSDGTEKLIVESGPFLMNECEFNFSGIVPESLTAHSTVRLNLIPLLYLV